ncbi:mechanosensitive ion channel domain-containing protein [Aliiroseovarius subalbicans]|uniref:mechanosensitive ion channel family protein n=2 Tax=Aliiroseovarius TaxID=1658781 RepID=UPI001F59425A|nr:mechanosensitive ion channel domain-containing protein [Aliiroseovarius subalbicans]MCI2399904.1 mechanosensitive ion channel [Aliiroseovarius subalbicans]
MAGEYPVPSLVARVDGSGASVQYGEKGGGMEQEEEIVEPILTLREQIEGLLFELVDFGQSLLQPWRLYQVAIIACLVVVALAVTWILRPRIEGWLRSREGWPKWRLRLAVHLRKRIPLFVFVILAWLTVAVMREVTWPSRSYLISLTATIAFAWLLVGLAAWFLQNRFLRRLVMWVLWIYVTVYYLGLTTAVGKVMENIAIEMGDFRISSLDVLRALVITGVLFALARFASKTTASKVQKNEDISPSMRVLVVKFLQVILYGAAFFIGLKAIGADLTGLAVLSGAIGVGLGFGLQKVVSNLVSGVIILLDKSIKPGDVISLGETFGWIQSLGARYVSVVTRDGKEYLIPNEDLITGQVVNWSHTNAFVRLDIFFGIAYGDDPHQVRKIAIDAAKSVNRVLSFRPPVCHIVGFGDSSVDYILRFWIDDPTGGLTNIRGNVYLALWDAFQEHGISIPFPQREVRMLDDGDTAGDMAKD